MTSPSSPLAPPAEHPLRDRSLYPTFSDAEMQARHRAVEALMAEAGVEALLVYGAGRYPQELFWLTDHPGPREGYLLIQPGQDPVYLVQLFNHVPLARSLSWVRDVRWAGPRTGRAVADLLAERGLESARIGLIGSTPYQQVQAFRQRHPQATFMDLSARFKLLRAVKSEAEIERLRVASRLTDQSMWAIKEALRPGVREDELPAAIERVYLEAGGYTGIHFLTSMPMRDPGFPVPAQYPSRRAIQPGDCLITEISGYYLGYGGQAHRTYSLGEGPTPEWQRLHDAAVEAFHAIFDAIRDGVSSRELEEAADVVHRRGYTILDDVVHGNAQLPPIIQTRATRRHEDEEVILRENMVLVIQPNVITPDERMGLQFGETVLVTKQGCESLDDLPREWFVSPL